MATDQKPPTSPTIVEVMDHPDLFGDHFRDPSWINWKIFLKALFNLPLSEVEKDIYREYTGRLEIPKSPNEAYVIVGRRGGKSHVCALIAVYLSCFQDYREQLSPGERATVMVLAADRKQTRTVMRYVKALLHDNPMLKRLVEHETAESIDLTNGATVEVHTASFRSVRGYTIAACIADELAFWRSEESSNPDVEILASIRPGMASIPSSLLIGISSPYSRRGDLWTNYRDYYGRESEDILIWKAPSRAMNPKVSEKVVQRHSNETPHLLGRNMEQSSEVI